MVNKLWIFISYWLCTMIYNYLHMLAIQINVKFCHNKLVNKL